MNGCTGASALERWQARVIRWMMLCSLLLHAGAIVLGTAVSSLFPQAAAWTVVNVELTEPPPTMLREEEPPPAAGVASRKPAPDAPSEGAARTHPATGTAPSPPRWLAKLRLGAAGVPDAPIVGKTAKPGLPVRRLENDASPRPGDFPPAFASEKSLSLGKSLEELEGRVRRSGRPGVGTGKEIEASVMFGGTGDSAGEPIPAWVRDMIRKKVRGYLPELERVYSSAIRRNPGLKGRLLVRFRIDSSGNVQGAHPAESSFADDAFAANVLNTVRRWTFDPPGNRAVEVLYPFLFVPPS